MKTQEFFGYGDVIETVRSLSFTIQIARIRLMCLFLTTKFRQWLRTQNLARGSILCSTA